MCKNARIQSFLSQLNKNNSLQWSVNIFVFPHYYHHIPKNDLYPVPFLLLPDHRLDCIHEVSNYFKAFVIYMMYHFIFNTSSDNVSFWKTESGPISKTSPPIICYWSQQQSISKCDFCWQSFALIFNSCFSMGSIDFNLTWHNFSR